MKIRTLTAAALLAVFATSTASAAKLNLTSTNNSDGAIAVGDTLVAGGVIGPGGAAGFIGLAGGRAIAGSVSLDVKGCGCKRKVTIENNGAGSVAVGRATAGSTRLTMY